MATRVEKFEDLIAWRKARLLTQEIYKMTKHGEFARDYALSNQMQRAAVSIMSNIAEGFERGKRGEFHQFHSVAKGSCAELRAQLYIAKDCNYIDAATFDRVMLLASEESRILGGLRAAVAKQRNSPNPS